LDNLTFQATSAIGRVPFPRFPSFILEAFHHPQ
jgi:hypothetical protein